ncbi:MAG TPA: AraC family transcriptional regulator [Polyangiaceae bacterium]
MNKSEIPHTPVPNGEENGFVKAFELERASFRFFSVDSPLSSYVEYLFASVVPSRFVNGVEAVRVPELEAQLVFVIEQGAGFYPGARRIAEGRYASLFLQPAHLRMIPISGTLREAVGAALSPTGLRLLLPFGSGELVDGPLIALEDLCGASALTLLDQLVAAQSEVARVALLRAYLEHRVREVGKPTLMGARAVSLLKAAHGELSIEALARTCGTTSRTLRNTLVMETGLAPKHLARILRIRRALELMVEAEAPLSGAALASAFSDQAHMCREFRALLGKPPARLGHLLHAPTQVIPRYKTERELIGTGLLILPKSPAE